MRMAMIASRRLVWCIFNLGLIFWGWWAQSCQPAAASGFGSAPVDLSCLRRAQKQRCAASFAFALWACREFWIALKAQHDWAINTAFSEGNFQTGHKALHSARWWCLRRHAGRDLAGVALVAAHRACLYGIVWGKYHSRIRVWPLR